MSSNFKVLFFLKKGRNSNPNSLPVYVRVTANGQRAEWSVQRTCEPKKWNRQKGRTTGSMEEAKNLNGYLDTLQGKIFSIQQEHALRNEPVTSEQVRSKILHKTEEKHPSLLEVYQYHNEQFQELVGLEFAHGTYKKFKSALKLKISSSGNSTKKMYT